MPKTATVFDGYAAAGIQGVRQGSSNPALTLPSNVRGYPGAVAQAVSQLRLAGVNGPYAVLLGAEAYTAVSGEATRGILSFDIFSVLSMERSFGRPPSKVASCLRPVAVISSWTSGRTSPIGYLSHSKTIVELYLQETFTFRLLTTEAAVVLAPGKK